MDTESRATGRNVCSRLQNFAAHRSLFHRILFLGVPERFIVDSCGVECGNAQDKDCCPGTGNPKASRKVRQNPSKKQMEMNSLGSGGLQ